MNIYLCDTLFKDVLNKFQFNYNKTKQIINLNKKRILCIHSVNPLTVYNEYTRQNKIRIFGVMTC